MKNKFSIAFKTKAKHGRIFQYMIDNEMTFIKLSKEIGVSKATLASILHFRWTPKAPGRGNYNKSKTVKKLCDFFDCDIVELFPEQLCRQIENNTEIAKVLQSTLIDFQETDLTFIDYKHIAPNLLSYEATQEEVLSKKESLEMIEKILATLTEREETILKLRFGVCGEVEHPLQAISEKLNITPERIRQIERKAIRKLQHPSRLPVLKLLAEGILK